MSISVAPAPHGAVGRGDGAVGDAGESAQDFDFCGRLDLAQSRQQRPRPQRTAPAATGRRARQNRPPADSPVSMPMRAAARPWRVSRSASTGIASKANSRHTAISTPLAGPGPDGARLHVDHRERRRAVRRHQRHGVTPAHQRLGRRQEACHIGEVFRRAGDDRIKPRLFHREDLPIDDVLAHSNSRSRGPGRPPRAPRRRAPRHDLRPRPRSADLACLR